MTKKVGANVVDEITPVEIDPGDYLMWVGSIYYPTADVYIEEAKRLGVCKRMGKLPHSLVPGKSKVFLAHDDGLNGEGFIFGYFIPERIEYLIPDEADIPETLEGKVCWVGEWGDEEERECGFRHEGMYAVFTSDPDEEEPETEGTFVIFARPRTLSVFDPGRKHFRGLLQIEYGKRLLRAKKSQTMVPPSRTAHEPIDPDTEWTEEEDTALLGLIDLYPSASKAAQKFAYASGRPKASVMYRYLKLSGRKNGDGENEGEE